MPADADLTAENTTIEEEGATGSGRERALEAVAQELARRAHVTRERPSDRVLLARLPSQKEALQDIYRKLVQGNNGELAISYAAEWFLDNYYVIQRAQRQVEEDLPPGYYDELPRLTEPDEGRGLPRVYMVARSLVVHEGCQIEIEHIRRFTHAYQEIQPLTMGELWALPLMLRLVLIHSIIQSASRLTETSVPRKLVSDPLLLHYEIDDADVVAAAVPSLHRLANQDWKRFFESVSLVEQELNRDPAGLYGKMDFETRNRYRQMVEILAAATAEPEVAVAHTAIQLASLSAETAAETAAEMAAVDVDGKGDDEWAGLEMPPNIHVGYYLLAGGREELEQALGYEARGIVRLRRWLLNHPTLVYLGSIGVVAALILGGLLFYAQAVGGTSLQLVLTFFILLIPVTSIAVGLVNWLLTHLIEPRVLPKLDFSEDVPRQASTAVVIPAMLTSEEEARSLLRQLELHYLCNPDPGIRYALLTDFADADSETTEDDDHLLAVALGELRAMNERHEGEPFYLLHRSRQWNEKEGVWMGWERKRGKLHEFNRLLRGATDTSYFVQEGDLDGLKGVQYVITLDADTVLPRESAHRLIGTLAHPLNRAQFDPQTGKVVSGYTVLQPRTEIQPTSATQSLFARVFAGDAGLDLYTLAVSDIYQDLFGEGIYVGKGIYDVDAFERSLEGKAPENALLSHDLFEGIQGRAGLVTDVVFYEDFPPHYLVHVRRSHRWVRGDWQLLPWLLPRFLRPKAYGNAQLEVIDWWKIFDNLRRSLNSPALLLLFVAGWTFLPGQPAVWMLLGLLAPAVSLATSLLMGIMRGISGASWREIVRPVRDSVVRWLLYLAFLPYESTLILDAVITTLVRLLITRRHLLQWTSAAHTARIFGPEVSADLTWKRMGSSLFVTVALGLIVAIFNPEALLVALPLLVTWLLSPQIAFWISRPEKREPAVLSSDEWQALRRLARRTWFFFEHFVGPDDNWLPPDHFQESPKGMVAHRTSPTNLGLYLVSVLSAYHLGYAGALDLILRLRPTFETLDRMDRYRGHFLNWIDTRTLAPLPPRYVSSVDSGNLAACFLALRQGCEQALGDPVLRWERWQGLQDVLGVLDEVVSDAADGEDGAVRELHAHLHQMQLRLNAARDDVESWIPLFLQVEMQGRTELDRLLLQLLESELPAVNATTLRNWRVHVENIHLHLSSMRRELEMLAPWLLAMNERPPIFEQEGPLAALWAELKERLPANPTLREVPVLMATGQETLEKIIAQLEDEQQGAADEQAADEVAAALQWSRSLQQKLNQARLAVESLEIGFRDLAEQSERYFQEMDFSFLFNKRRQVFHIGYNMDTGQLDRNYYDLLASEARIMSLVAIVKNDVPQSHWLHLARPITEVDSGRTLLSWSGTMFEYLMPPLWLRRYEGTLLNDSEYNAVDHQIAYGRKNGVPWGISESGFFTFDSAMNYQYRAFGVPGLGFKRGLGEDMVISPYASLLAVSLRPREVVENLRELQAQGMLGRYGFYEAIDFTEARLKLGHRYEIVRSFMAHHQGMILVALLNYLQDNRMVEHFHRDARIQSAELLLQEQVPHQAPLEFPSEEDITAVRPAEPAIATHPWPVPLHSPLPSVRILSNGRYRVLLTNAGAGYSRWRDVALTRWRSDTTKDNWGQWLYVEELDNDVMWSVGMQPITPGVSPSPRARDLSGQGEVLYYPYMAEFRRREHNIVLRMDVTVPPADDVEVRRVRITNDSEESRRLRLTSYGEVVLVDQATDERHQAFVKLFVESEYVEELNALLFRKRTRSDQEEPIFLAHMLVLHGDIPETKAYESDRARFLGRGRTPSWPVALESEEWLSGTTGATLDPIMSLGQVIELEPHASIELALVTGVARSRREVLELMRGYRSWSNIERAFGQARAAVERTLRVLDLESPDLEQAQRLLSLLLYPHHAFRAESGVLATNERGQSGLWGFGISGDYPILLIEVEEESEAMMLQEVLRAHAYWRSLGLEIDLVILNRKESTYGQELQGAIHRLIRQEGSENWMNRRGGIFLVRRDQMGDADYVLLQSAARVVLDGHIGSLAAELNDFYQQATWLPAFTASRTEPEPEIEPVARPADLVFDNGYGGFSPDGTEYLVYLEPGQQTPAPWINVVANPEFGFLVSESGSGYTWSVNSGENRLTTWRNDPVSDMPAEALYLRDEETAEVWSPTPQPAPAPAPYLVRHGAGYSQFEHNSHGLQQKLRLFVAPDAPVKIVELRVENRLSRPRRITATFYAEWVLGTSRDTEAFIIPEYAKEHQALLARNPYNVEFGERVAFMASSRSPHGLTADRTEFIGRLGSLRRPAALQRIGLENRVEAGRDSCAVIQIHLDLEVGGAETVYFLVGQGDNREQALELLSLYLQPEQVAQAWEATHRQWDEILQTVQVETPDPAMDLLLNRWLLYQALSCRIWGRSALYQSSGAYGFRDQLQDVMAVIHVCPDIAREQILRAARHQFQAGDVLHWWHPPSGRGVRTRIKDDLLWLPYVTAYYVAVTNDTSILQEEVPFLQGDSLADDEEERYGQYSSTEETYTIFEHCRRALVKGSSAGRHGLPLIGGGDWNDGMNRVGIEGKGESVWLGWFLLTTLQAFASLCREIGEEQLADAYEEQAEALRKAIETTSWDGKWYRRAYYDDGTPLGSAQNRECQIDAIAQSWSVLSGAGRKDRTDEAMDSVLERLVKWDERLVLLFTPPFDQTFKDPGYIKGYLPGIRENGGQYTHAALWTIWAYAEMGRTELAEQLFRLINPIYRADSKEKADHYKVEPYVISADVYGVDPHTGRGGWTWYTGSSAWMYRLGVEQILGLKPAPGGLRIAPRIPPHWPGFRATYRAGGTEGTLYEIEVQNGDGQRVVELRLDGQQVEGDCIPLQADGVERRKVFVRLGR